MSIHGSQDFHGLSPLDRIQPVKDRDNEEERYGKGRKRSQYLGRAWSEEEEDELLLDMPLGADEKVAPTGIYANRLLLEKARKVLDGFSTVEEKLSQLCFYSIEADYDRERQQIIEDLVKKGNVGGLVFTRGDFRRETYLIERFQELSKSPILMGNDFLQGLYFYFQGECPINLLPEMSEAHLCDLAKAIVFQNRKLGVQLQLVRQHFSSKGGLFSLEKEKSRAFGRGLREAHAIVGRERSKEQTVNTAKKRPLVSTFSLSPTEPAFEVFSLRTLYYLDLTRTSGEDFEEIVISSFAQSFDILLLPGIVTGIPALLARLFAQGRIPINILDRQVLKVILLKMGAFPSRYPR